MGLTTALSPQIDLSTEPRWRRFYGSFSESPELSRDMAQTYCDAFQTTKGSKNGWGDESVNCMVKHWPGGGSGEGGRDAHFGIGIMGSALKLRTPPKYAALRLAREAYYIVFDVLTIKTRIHHQYLLSGRGTTGTAFRNKDTHFVSIR